MPTPTPANSALHAISICQEAEYGVLNTGQPFKKKLITATTLALAKGKIVSNTINSNRQVMDVRHGNRQVAGDITTELAFAGFDDFIEACMCSTWNPDTHQIVPGVTRRSFSVLRQFTDLPSESLPFQLLLGVEVNTMALTLAPEAIAKIVFGCVGRELEYHETAPDGTEYTDITANKGFDSFSGTMTADGTSVAVVTALSLSIANGLVPRYVLFEDRTNQPKIGRTTITGQLTMYFADSSFLVAFNGAVKKALQFSMIDLYGNEYLFTLPSVLASGGQTDANGENDITITWPFSAIYELGADDPDALTIERIPSGEGAGGGGGDPDDGFSAAGVHLPIAELSTYTIAPGAAYLIYTQPFLADAGTGAYAQTVAVSNVQAQSGEIMYIPIQVTGDNPTINFHDESAGGTLLQTVVAAGRPSDSFLLTLRFDGVNWHKLDGHWVL